MNVVLVADGRNDGRKRVYAGSQDGHVYEFTRTGDQWDALNVGQVVGPVQCMIAGDGRNEGASRIYVAFGDYVGSGICEFHWTGSEWETSPVVTVQARFGHIAIGPVRNDGTNRLYANWGGGYVHELSWAGDSWCRSDIPVGNAEWSFDLGVGSARNDGLTRLYSSSGDRHVYEITWAQSFWDCADLGTFSRGYDAISMSIGNGRSDAISRLYASSWDGGVYELSWAGNGWYWSDIGICVVGAGQIAIGIGRNDGQERVYVVSGVHTTDGVYYAPFEERTWTASGWGWVIYEWMTAKTRGISVGAGRNDDTNRVYAASEDGVLYEFTWRDPSGTVQTNPAPNIPSRGRVGSLLSWAHFAYGNRPQRAVAIPRMKGDNPHIMKLTKPASTRWSH